MLKSGTSTEISIAPIKEFLLSLQNQICEAIANEDQQEHFQEDNWSHTNGGGGITRVLQNGRHIEQAGVNFSHVLGTQLPPAATQQRPELIGRQFEALGISLIIHPRNPYAPTMHANLRFFLAPATEEQPAVWWFGGGLDLTPYYGFEEDCEHWHRTIKQHCDPFGDAIYPKFKRWCDQYFHIKHRQEARGIGGIFFDDLNEWDFLTTFNFVKNIGASILEAYQPILQRRKNLAYGETQREFQCYRRGRYVEFNLVYDRGTLFGLQSNGRTESILVSLPPAVNWRYNWQPRPNSEESRLYTDFLPPKEWV